MTTTRATTAKSLLAGSRGFHGDIHGPDSPVVGQDEDARLPVDVLERETRLVRDGAGYLLTICQRGHELGRAWVVQGEDGDWYKQVIFRLEEETKVEAARRLNEADGPHRETVNPDPQIRRRQMEEFVRGAQADLDDAPAPTDELRLRRDDAVCIALIAGYTYDQITRWTGLDPDAIATISNLGRDRTTWAGRAPSDAARPQARQHITLPVLHTVPALTDRSGRTFQPSEILVRELRDHDDARLITARGGTLSKDSWGIPTGIAWVTGFPYEIDIPPLDEAPEWLREHVAAGLESLALPA